MSHIDRRKHLSDNGQVALIEQLVIRRLNASTQFAVGVALAAHPIITSEMRLAEICRAIPSLPANGYAFAPAPIGRVNLDFRYVTTVGEIICYAVSRTQRVLLQLVSLVRIRVEGIGPGACGDPGTWAFSAGAVEFER